MQRNVKRNRPPAPPVGDFQTHTPNYSCNPRQKFSIISHAEEKEPLRLCSSAKTGSRIYPQSQRQALHGLSRHLPPYRHAVRSPRPSDKTNQQRSRHERTEDNYFGSSRSREVRYRLRELSHDTYRKAKALQLSFQQSIRQANSAFLNSWLLGKPVGGA